jgi:hypothetical protein
MCLQQKFWVAGAASFRENLIWLSPIYPYPLSSVSGHFRLDPDLVQDKMLQNLRINIILVQNLKLNMYCSVHCTVGLTLFKVAIFSYKFAQNLIFYIKPACNFNFFRNIFYYFIIWKDDLDTDPLKIVSNPQH